MKIMSFNVRGLGKKMKRNDIKQMISKMGTICTVFRNPKLRKLKIILDETFGLIVILIEHGEKQRVAREALSLFGIGKLFPKSVHGT
ncbi:hypothetical protein ACS0TY_025954 [Phlomoides rotata]